jgi:3-methyl-2-oxobutanoate hydroxymethyltransferase
MSPTIAAITRSGIPVFGHIGVTPQRNLASEMTETENAASLLKDAESVENAGAVAIVLEGIPSRVASAITEALKIPTIGIGYVLRLF